MPILNLNSLFPGHYQVMNLEQNIDQVSLEIRSNKNSNRCPVCKHTSTQIHSHYSRTLFDLPIGEYKVVINLLSKKFFCNNPECTRHIFAERHSGFALPYARKTERLESIIRKLGFHLSAQVASAIIKSIFMPMSPNSILRLIRKTIVPVTSTFKHVGIDDWSFKKRKTYGTLVCDLITGKPIELLSNRDTQTVASWLREHPSITVLSRDRSSSYSKAATMTLPDAKQVADRWHLIKNLFETLKLFLETNFSNGLFLKPKEESAERLDGKEKLEQRQRITKLEKQSQDRLKRKIELINEVKKLYGTGISQREIAAKLNLVRGTVCKYVYMEDMPAIQRRKRSSLLDGYYEIIHKQVEENSTVKKIFNLIASEGFCGTESLVKTQVTKLRKQKKQGNKRNPPEKKVHITRDCLQRMLFKTPNDLTAIQREKLHACLDHSSKLKEVYDLSQHFKLIIQNQETEKLGPWLSKTMQCSITVFRKFAKGIQNDIDAVRNSLIFQYSNGLLEGHVNRLKTIKRQMYGRANFDLLKQKVLYQMD